MLPQTLKRQAEDVGFNNDGNEYDVTWGGTKKSRYLYSYPLQSSDLFSNINDSYETENKYSLQSRKTIAVEPGFLSESSCVNDSDCCLCQSCSSQSDHTELKVTNYDPFLDIDNGYAPDDDDFLDDTQSSFPDVFSNFFKFCLLCKTQNSNPSFQFCHKCFRFRMKLFDIKPDQQPKSIKRLNKMFNHLEELRSCNDSIESCSSITSSSGLSSLCLSQGSVNYKPENLCSICYLKPVNGIFNHGQIGHVFCCYHCSKKIWAKSGRCPICNRKIRYVTKAISV